MKAIFVSSSDQVAAVAQEPNVTVGLGSGLSWASSGAANVGYFLWCTDATWGTQAVEELARLCKSNNIPFRLLGGKSALTSTVSRSLATTKDTGSGYCFILHELSH